MSISEDGWTEFHDRDETRGDCWRESLRLDIFLSRIGF